ncbi:NAD(P)-binding protein [Durotheca rogersii]|uniref:NAD(P)-binding protein n=1 Tax=Durotheca rogersii TaxID=419775 RepID=UPI00221F9B1F|nr:NAD(P)-binding protein [Durotheca rogersii]KAI5861666.1 NAD(P)-binding protein [Durotheca rogersii]
MDDISPTRLLLGALAAVLAIGILWVGKLNATLKKTPPEVLAVSPHRWTEAEMRAVYDRIRAKPVDWASHLPPRATLAGGGDRRYIITGGSGGVGGTIVLHLLARGHPPEALRIVDFRPPDRPELTTGAVARVDFVRADITSATGTTAAFDAPWPAAVRDLPLTVFHTAAVISHADRSMITYERVRGVNVDGVRHVLDAARAAGASVFVSTSSASVAYRPVEYWGNPLRRWPRNYWQAIDEADFARPLRPHPQFFGNYAYSKAVAERIIAEANAPGFRTGIVRPANGIYGTTSTTDQIVGYCLRVGTFPSWIRNIIQNFVHAGNVSLGHLAFEAALLQDDRNGNMPKCAGQAFTVTDDGPPTMFDDVYNLLKVIVATPPIKVIYLQPGLMLVLAYVVELFDLASRLPVVGRIVPRPQGSLAMLQPAIFSASTNHIATDTAARRSVEDGGIAYRPLVSTMEGVCQQVLDWNIEHGK